MCFFSVFIHSASLSISRTDQITFERMFSTQLRKNNNILLSCSYPAATFSHALLNIIYKCTYMHRVFVFGRMTYDATFSMHSTITAAAATTLCKKKIIENCWQNVFIELTLFEVVHMNLLANSLFRTDLVTFSRICLFAFYCMEVQKKSHTHTHAHRVGTHCTQSISSSPIYAPILQ